jgi:hypothetical protein
MPANDNRLVCRSEGRFTLTKHARERMAARGLRADAVESVLWFGRAVHTRGADIYVIGRKEVAKYAREGLDLAAFEGIQVVATCDGQIVTVYRNRRFRGLRPLRRAGRRDVAA